MKTGGNKPEPKLEKPQQPPKDNNGKFINDVGSEQQITNINKLNKYYFIIYKNRYETGYRTLKLKIKKQNDKLYFNDTLEFKSIYRGDDV